MYKVITSLALLACITVIAVEMIERRIPGLPALTPQTQNITMKVSPSATPDGGAVNTSPAPSATGLVPPPPGLPLLMR